MPRSTWVRSANTYKTLDTISFFVDTPIDNRWIEIRWEK